MSVLAAVQHRVAAAGLSGWNLLGLPGQTAREMALFKEILLSKRAGTLRVFEWGLGRSTVYYPALLAKARRDFEWYGIDNSPMWHDRIKRRLEQRSFGGRVHVSCRAFPAFWQVPGYSWRNPPRFEAFPDQERVIEYINFPKGFGVQFDVVIIDGRFRRRCLAVAREVAHPDGVVLLHDAQRRHYHSSFSLYPYSRMVEGGVWPGGVYRSQTWVGRLKAPMSP